jgi:steroid delta-isomerase-like uncharacterized protein
MSTKENKELIRQVIKERNEIVEDTAKLRSWCEKYCAPGLVHHLLPPKDLDWEQNMQYLATVLSAIPDFNKSIDDMVAEGDKVVTRHTIQATHKATIAGIPATGKHVSIKGSDIYKIEGNKILEWWEFNDMLGLMTQIGAVISPPPRK